MNARSVGELLRRARHRKRLSQEELAELAGLHANTVIGIELGRNDHNMGTYELIGDALGLSLVDIARAAQRPVR